MFLEVKFSIYLNRRVFVMPNKHSCFWSPKGRNSFVKHGFGLPSVKVPALKRKSSSVNIALASFIKEPILKERDSSVNMGLASLL